MPTDFLCLRPQCIGRMVSKAGDSLICDTCGQISSLDEYRYLSRKANPMLDPRSRQAAKEKIASEVDETAPSIIPSAREIPGDITTNYEAKSEEQKWWKKQKIAVARPARKSPRREPMASIHTNEERLQWKPDFKKLFKGLKILFLISMGGLLIFALVMGGQWLGSTIKANGNYPAVTPAPGLEISGADISGITQSGAVIKWATSEPAGGHISYGKTESLEHSQNSDELLTQQRIDLTGLDEDSTYYFRLDAVTKDGRNAFPYSSSFNTLPAPDVTPPLISQVEVWGISDIEARISWQTDENTASVIEYGLSSRYGKSITLEGEPAQQHTYTLSGLTPQTTYHFRIRSIDAADNRFESEDSIFSTLEEIKVGYAAGNRAPDFTLQSLDGRTWTLSALRGRLVMVNFWRLSCGPCVAELPHFDAVHRTYEGSRPLDLLAVNLGDYTTHLNNMVAEKGYAFNILLQGAGVGSKYGISSIPMTFFIDEDGIIQKVKRGKFNSPDEIREILNSLQL